MFTITRQQSSSSFLPLSSQTHPSASTSKYQYGANNLDAMDLDMDVELDFNEYQYETQQQEGQAEVLVGVVTPGEVITSSKEYMRYVSEMVEDKGGEWS